MKAPKRTWKDKSQCRFPLEELEYKVPLRRTDFPLFYTPMYLTELVLTNWLELRRRCSHTFQRVLFVWPADNESKSYRIPLDLLFRCTLKRTLHVAVFRPFQWYVNRVFNVRVFPTVLWLGWDGKWIELGRFEGGNFDVKDLLDVERGIDWEGMKIGKFEVEKFEEEVHLDRWERRLQWLAHKRNV